ncbi:hypothetical protein LXL04_032318 [Taraxacum kok-saghyz]
MVEIGMHGRGCDIHVGDLQVVYQPIKDGRNQLTSITNVGVCDGVILMVVKEVVAYLFFVFLDLVRPFLDLARLYNTVKLLAHLRVLDLTF